MQVHVVPASERLRILPSNVKYFTCSGPRIICNGSKSADSCRAKGRKIMLNASLVGPLRSTLTCVAAIGLAVTTTAGPATSHATSIWEPRVFIDNKCPRDAPPPPPPPGAPAPPPAALVSVLGFLIPKVVDFGLSLANSALTAKAQAEQDKNKPKTTEAIVPAEAFYRLEGGSQPALSLPLRDQCLIFVRGNFGGKPPTAPEKDCGFKHPALAKPHACEWLNGKGIFASSAGNPVGIYLEAKFVFPDEQTTFRVQPNFFLYQVPLTPPEQADDRYD